MCLLFHVRIFVFNQFFKTQTFKNDDLDKLREITGPTNLFIFIEFLHESRA